MITHSKVVIFKIKVFLAPKPIEPHTFNQAIKDSNWQLALEIECNALMRNKTQHLILYHSNGNVTICKQVYKLKYKPNQSIDQYKAHLVANGLNQTHGFDYFETCSPIIIFSTIRIVLNIALFSQWLIRQLDVQNFFLNGDLQEQMVMSQPLEFVSPQFLFNVCYLNKELYDLKQVPYTWFSKLSTSLSEWGFQFSCVDSSIFLHHITFDILLLLIHIDDILVIGNNSSKVFLFIAYLKTSFAYTLHLNHQKYIYDLFTRT